MDEQVLWPLGSPLNPSLIYRGVGVGELTVSDEPGVSLTAHGLGSCVGVVAWDPALRLGGLAHVQLPETGPDRPGRSPWVGADRAVPELLRRLEALRSARPAPDRPRRLRLALVGAAEIGLRTDPFRIAARNAEACQRALSHLGLQPGWSLLGGSAWRGVRLHIGSGAMMLTQPEGRELLWPADPEVEPPPWPLHAVSRPQ